MPSSTIDPVVASVLSAAREATGAGRVLLLAVDGDALSVVAADGDDTERAIGARVELGQGIAGFVAASGQPVALRPSSTDERLDSDVALTLGWEPTGVCTVPCADGDAIVGVLELLDPNSDGGFDFDDVENASVLAGVAGAALGAMGHADPVATPGELRNGLAALADADPRRYATVASLVQALLDGD